MAASSLAIAASAWPSSRDWKAPASASSSPSPGVRDDSSAKNRNPSASRPAAVNWAASTILTRRSAFGHVAARDSAAISSFIGNLRGNPPRRGAG